MRRIFALILTINLCFIVLAPLGAKAQSDKLKSSIRKNEAAIRGQYIVVFKSDTDRNKIAKLASDMTRFHGGNLLYTYEHAVKGFSVEMSEAAAHALSNNPNRATRTGWWRNELLEQCRTSHRVST